MTERQLLRELTKQIKNIEGVHWNKLDDTFGGHKKPYDVEATYKGRSFYLEFKKGEPGLEPHQEEKLTSGYSAGAVTYVCCFTKNKKRNHERDLFCYPLIWGVVKKENAFRLNWDKGKYVHLDIFFENLIAFFW